MGGGASHDQQAMQDLADKLEEFDPLQFCVDKLGSKSLPVEYWPLCAQWSARPAYAEVYQAIYDASDSLEKVTTALGSVISEMASAHGREQEQQSEEVGQVDDSGEN